VWDDRDERSSDSQGALRRITDRRINSPLKLGGSLGALQSELELSWVIHNSVLC